MKYDMNEPDRLLLRDVLSRIAMSPDGDTATKRDRRASAARDAIDAIDGDCGGWDNQATCNRAWVRTRIRRHGRRENRQVLFGFVADSVLVDTPLVDNGASWLR